MRIYEFEVQEGFEWVVPAAGPDFEIFGAFDGGRRGRAWTPVQMRLVKEDERGRPLRSADIPWLGEHAPVFKVRASAALGAMLARDGEFLPLACAEAALEVLNVTTILDALDMEASTVLRFADSGRVMKVQSHVFRPACLHGVYAFKVPEMLRGSVFVTEDVVSAVKDAALIGVGFRLLWEERTNP